MKNVLAVLFMYVFCLFFAVNFAIAEVREFTHVSLDVPDGYMVVETKGQNGGETITI